MAQCPVVELIVRPAPGRGLRYWLWSLLGEAAFSGLLHLSSGHDHDRFAPAVIARTVSGERHVLLRMGTNRQACLARDRLQRELDSCGESEFRRRHGLQLAPKSGR